MTRNPSGARVKIGVPLNRTLQPPIDVVVNVAQSVKVSLDKNVLMEGFGKSNNGIHIFSDETIVVHVFSQSLSTIVPDTVGGYLAFPYTALGTEYMTVTYCSKYSCYIGIMATANSTEVTLTFKTTVTLDGVVCLAGTTKQLNLDHYEAFQIKSSDDLTGIRITSNKVISVTVGADGTPVDGMKEDYLIEQLPPITALGTNHYLLPMPLRTIGDFVRVVALTDETQFRVDGVAYEMKVVGDHQDLTLTPTTLHFLHSTLPVLVAQFCKSSKISETSYTDPNQLIIPPVRQWTGSYVFATPALAQTNNAFHLTLVAINNCTEEVQLNHGDILESWIPSTNSTVSMTTITLTTEYHNITHKTGCKKVWGYIYGTALHQSWALPIGWSFQPMKAAKIPTTDDTITSDQSTVDLLPPTDKTLSSFSSHGLLEPTLTLSTTSFINVLDTSGVSVSEASRYSWDFKLSTAMSESLTETHSISVSPVTPNSADAPPTYITLSTPYVFDPSSSSLVKSVSAYLSTQNLGNNESSSTSSSSSSSSSAMTISSTETTRNLTTPANQTHIPSRHTNNNLCGCGCFHSDDSTVEVRIRQAQLGLYVDKEKLGSTIRKKTSVQDDRRSAQVVGYAGIIFIVLVLSWAVIPDILKVLRFLWYVICRGRNHN
ncbi:hypothetical protein LOTGIDRAFT_174330 [Lottia gigantea]|uniref:IgGFc-binding protein N-terminal domain-containing protein n=1 Tax=Lottia gigantea TaxID=225164 RepID=V4AT96_LOTGI|nr:hypothetical protein LOTGIDRAFT_174330 [Lottia gigantea]ESO98115.1 hypothetical protein LOTGIDRAFT_174330 [Lottia gigantea]